MASLWEMISAGSSANARKLANANQPNYVSAEEMKNSPTPQQTWTYRDWETDRKSTRLNSSHSAKSRMPSSA